MPDGLVLYWYGNECVDVTGGWYVPDGYQGKKYINYFEAGTAAGLGNSVYGAMVTNNMFNINGKTVIHGIHDAKVAHCGTLITTTPNDNSNWKNTRIVDLATNDVSENKHTLGYYYRAFTTNVTDAYCIAYVDVYNNGYRYNKIYAIYLT